MDEKAKNIACTDNNSTGWAILKRSLKHTFNLLDSKKTMPSTLTHSFAAESQEPAYSAPPKVHYVVENDWATASDQTMILLPEHIRRQIAVAEECVQTVIVDDNSLVHDVPPEWNLKDCVRAWTVFDVTDAQAVSDRIIGDNTRQFATIKLQADVRKFLTALALYLRYTWESEQALLAKNLVKSRFFIKTNNMLHAMLDYLSDPEWENPLHIIMGLRIDYPSNINNVSINALLDYDPSCAKDKLVATVISAVKKIIDPATVCGTISQDSDMIDLYSMESLDAAHAMWNGKENDQKMQFNGWIKSIQQWDGRREMLSLSGEAVAKVCDDLAAQFPNFVYVVDFLRFELALNFSVLPEAFRVAPMLLYGPPGIGKTAFTEALAAAIGSTVVRVNASANLGSELTGTSKHYTNAMPGRVFESFARHKSASPVVLLDEVDKMRGDDRDPMVNGMLGLLEADTAKVFEDQAVGLVMDTSKAIVIATANNIRDIPAPILSRCHVLEVVPPTPKQIRQIAECMAKKLTSQLRKNIDIPAAVLDKIALDSVDLRELNRRIRNAVGHAILTGKQSAEAETFVKEPSGRRAMGFV